MVVIVSKKIQKSAKPSKKAKPASKSKAPKPSDELRPEELDKVAGGTLNLSFGLGGMGAPAAGALSPYVPILAATKLKP